MYPSTTSRTPYATTATSIVGIQVYGIGDLAPRGPRYYYSYPGRSAYRSCTLLLVLLLSFRDSNASGLAVQVCSVAADFADYPGTLDVGHFAL